jgi:hypothetical protein
MTYCRQQMPMRHIKKIHATLHFGKQRSLAIHLGQLHVVLDVPVGIWNVLQWRTHI